MIKDKQQLIELLEELPKSIGDSFTMDPTFDLRAEAAEAIQSLLVENERLREGLTQIVEETKYVENPYARLAWKIARTLLRESDDR